MKAAMAKKKLNEFKEILQSRMDELVSEARQQVGELTEVKENLADMTDQASAEVDRDFLLRIKDRERKLILKHREALARIDDGSFGICEMCGEPIGEERLKARPVTTQCIECKTDMEEQERRKEA
jgi:DnaK suppressor protein